MEVGSNRVRIELYTHSVEGLSINDFILAAKITKGRSCPARRRPLRRHFERLLEYEATEFA